MSKKQSGVDLLDDVMAAHNNTTIAIACIGEEGIRTCKPRTAAAFVAWWLLQVWRSKEHHSAILEGAQKSRFTNVSPAVLGPYAQILISTSNDSRDKLVL